MLRVAPTWPSDHAKVAGADAVAFAAPSLPAQLAGLTGEAEAVSVFTNGILTAIRATQPVVVEVAVTVKTPDARLLRDAPAWPSDHAKVAGWLPVKVAEPFGAAQVAPKMLLAVTVKLEF